MLALSQLYFSASYRLIVHKLLNSCKVVMDFARGRQIIRNAIVLKQNIYSLKTWLRSCNVNRQ